jgi:serine/threonine-protein kinase
MEYVDGYSLAQYVAAAAPLEPLEAAQIVLQISAALASAHDLGIVHRDIKPENVMLTREHTAKLADFGLAKRVRAGKRSSTDNNLCGTPHYMSPELFQGKPAEKTSDVYAMGVTFFNLLTRDLPLTGQTVSELMRWHTSEEPLQWQAKCQALPEPVLSVLAQCLARDPRRRFADGSELHAALRSVYGSLRSLSSLLVEALHGMAVECHEENDQFQVHLRLKDGRSQRVHVELAEGFEPNQEVIRIFSVCGPMCPAYVEKALELNARLHYGAIGTERVGGQLCFVMANAFPRASCDPEEIRRSILAIGSFADEVERLLIGDDLN